MSASDRVLFSQFFEALFLRAYGKELTPRLKERLRGIGVDLDRDLLPAYPYEIGKQALQIAVEELYPGAPRDASLHEMGRRFIGGWQSTLVGKAAAAMLRVVGPRRSLLRLERAFRTGDNFTRVEAEELSPTRVRVRFSDVLDAAEFYAGILHEGGVLTGALHPRTTIESTPQPGAVILVEWEG